ncbi:triose-phosphate isomerase [Sphingomonas sp. HITSZ_GF]|uniref:triose-phosphate isomerase n=1 Tax=Sphingomonas sp. HITSZ_GF TaxID=3037247 RepID=UPI00240E03ED|nr:triose-phosphate isomerase family protein [Sphingomonas sp. HITSZ_GF]MDG2532131.1 triose-phosphate isomerase [Sphingomonas sp. HITSZ_GF]
MSPARRRPLVLGNWKMHGLGADLAEIARIDAAAGALGVEAGLMLPAALIERAARQVRGLAIGGQDCHPAVEGAHTGSASAAMLRDAGATITLVGHSETREDGLSVAAKACAAQAAGLSVVICVGESARSADARALVAAQLRASLPPELDWSRAAIAYEPVWCIGGSAVPDAAHLVRVFAMLRAEAGDAPLLYGGAVDGSNAGELLALPEVDGLLVGRASRSAAEFVPVLEAAAG